MSLPPNVQAALVEGEELSNSVEKSRVDLETSTLNSEVSLAIANRDSLKALVEEKGKELEKKKGDDAKELEKLANEAKLIEVDFQKTLLAELQRSNDAKRQELNTIKLEAAKQKERLSFLEKEKATYELEQEKKLSDAKKNLEAKKSAIEKLKGLF